MKKFYISLAALFSIVASLIFSCCGNSVALEGIVTAVDNRDFRAAMDEILKYKDKKILDNDSLLQLLSASYYGLAMKEKRQVASDCKDMVVLPDGKSFLINDGLDSVIKVFALPSMDSVRVIRTGTRVNNMSLSPDGSTLAVSRINGSIALYDVASGKEKKALRGSSRDGEVKMVGYKEVLKNTHAVSPQNNNNKNKENSGSSTPQSSSSIMKVNQVLYINDATVFTLSGNSKGELWNVKTGNATQIEGADFSNINRVSFSKDGNLMATASKNGAATIYNIKAGKATETAQIMPGDNFVSFAMISPDNKYLVTLTGDEIARIWDISSKKMLHEVPMRTQLNSFDFSADGKYFMVGAVENAYIVETATGKVITRIVTEGRPVVSVQMVGNEIAYADNRSFDFGTFLQGEKLIEAARKYTQQN